MFAKNSGRWEHERNLRLLMLRFSRRARPGTAAAGAMKTAKRVSGMGTDTGSMSLVLTWNTG
jgi:hypothetical protein